MDACLKELVILRVTQQCGARYAWSQYTELARTIGVSNLQIAALNRGDVPVELFSKPERAVLAFTDEALRGPRVSDQVFAEVRNNLASGEVVELLLIVGYFRLKLNCILRARGGSWI